MVAHCPFATYIEDDPPGTLDLATLPALNPRSILCGFFPASFAARSTALRTRDFLPFFQWISVRTLTFKRTDKKRFQRSEFSMGRPDRFFHAFLLHSAARL